MKRLGRQHKGHGKDAFHAAQCGTAKSALVCQENPMYSRREGTEAMNLLFSGTCGGQAFFCDRRCQKAGWKEHKSRHHCRKKVFIEDPSPT